MSAHLTPIVLNSLADGELSPEQLAAAQQHLEVCCACTSKALGQALLKAAVAKTGHRYSPPPELAERLKQVAANEPEKADASPEPAVQGHASGRPRVAAFAGWALAATLLLAGVILVERNLPNSGHASIDSAALVSEIRDLHVAALADTAPAEVISTDRHTVKPWFQGKIPFTFNLPEQLPADVKLEGANLTYLDGQPVAQLFYSIGRHRVSVFLRQRMETNATGAVPREHAGFHLTGFSTDELDAVAISDVDPARLSALATIIEQAQANAHK